MRLPALAMILASVGTWSCESGHPPPPRAVPRDEPDGAQYFDLPEAGRPDPDSGWLCGSLIEPIAVDRPNFYFVLDASGSMSAPPDPPIPRIPSVYLAARAAIGEVVRAVGHRVNYGAALFPGAAPSLDVPCPPGVEVFETQSGDSVRYALEGEDGPVLESLLRVLGLRSPGGTTPTGATLRELRPTLEGLEGETFVFLITDGAPNCNEEAVCGPDTCEANLVGSCDESVNCCAPSAGAYAHLGCIDADPTVQAVADLAAAGVHTFVIGLPGTEAFSDLLDRIALAGGTGRDRAPYYYPVDKTEQLSEMLRALGAQVAVDCHVELSEPPPDASLVNVYFDDRRVDQSDVDGWRWASDVRIEMVGPSCEELQTGLVFRVQVAAGCPTVIR